MAERTVFKGNSKGIKKMLKGKTVHYLAGIPRQHFTLAEKIEKAEKICAVYGTGKYSLKRCCKQFHVSHSSFMLWARPSLDMTKYILEKLPFPKHFIEQVHLMYKDALKYNDENYKELVKDVAKTAMIKRIEGYETTEVSEKFELDTRMYIDVPDPDDEEKTIKQLNPDFGKMVAKERTVKTKTVAPSDTLIIFGLTNTDPTNFKDRKGLDIPALPPSSTTGLESLPMDQLRARRLELAQKLKESTEDIEFENIEDETTNN